MLYSASRRTDMPAFYPDAIVSRVKRSRRLDGIVLWTKDIRNLVRHAELPYVITSWPTVVNYTVTGLAGGPWEPCVPVLEKQLEDLALLADRLPRGAILWRFDPIMPFPDVLDRFHRVKNLLESAMGRLEQVTVSFPDPYKQAVARSNAAGLDWPQVEEDEKKRLLRAMAAAFEPTASPPVRLCCEPELLELPCVAMAHCIDGALFERLYGLPLTGLEKDAGQRAACGCAKSTDIGSYAMRCGHGCQYCYARPASSSLD